MTPLMIAGNLFCTAPKLNGSGNQSGRLWERFAETFSSYSGLRTTSFRPQKADVQKRDFHPVDLHEHC